MDTDQVVHGGHELARRQAARARARRVGQVLQAALVAWWNDNGPRLGASLSYYTLFAIAPVLLVAIAIAGVTASDTSRRKPTRTASAPNTAPP